MALLFLRFSLSNNGGPAVVYPMLNSCYRPDYPWLSYRVVEVVERWWGRVPSHHKAISDVITVLGVDLNNRWLRTAYHLFGLYPRYSIMNVGRVRPLPGY